MGGSKAVATLLSLAALAALAAPTSALAATKTGGVAAPSSGGSGSGSTGGSQFSPPVTGPTSPGSRLARLVNGVAYAPAGAPRAVVRAIRAGNKLQDKPYLYGGGHKSFVDTAYDCSGTVSFALHGAKLLSSPLPSGSLMSWGVAGVGRWITVYSNVGHTYMVIAGLRLDTSGTGGRGPRWQLAQRDPAAFVPRHPAGL